MRRIGFAVVLALSLVLAPLAAEAQPAQKIALVGVLDPGRPPLGLLEAFRQGLSEHGYVEGGNLKIEWRFAEGRNERLPELATETCQSKGRRDLRHQYASGSGGKGRQSGDPDCH